MATYVLPEQHSRYEMKEKLDSYQVTSKHFIYNLYYNMCTLFKKLIKYQYMYSTTYITYFWVHLGLDKDIIDWKKERTRHYMDF